MPAFGMTHALQRGTLSHWREAAGGEETKGLRSSDCETECEVTRIEEREGRGKRATIFT